MIEVLTHGSYGWRQYFFLLGKQQLLLTPPCSPLLIAALLECVSGGTVPSSWWHTLVTSYCNFFFKSCRITEFVLIFFNNGQNCLYYHQCSVASCAMRFFVQSIQSVQDQCGFSVTQQQKLTVCFLRGVIHFIVVEFSNWMNYPFLSPDFDPHLISQYLPLTH